MKRREALIGLAASALFAGVGRMPDAAAQAAWPERAVTIVVPFTAGGTTDLFAQVGTARRVEDTIRP